MTERSLVMTNDGLIKTFNANNSWINTSLSYDSLLSSDFLNSGFDPAILSTSYNSIYINMVDSGELGTDGYHLYISNDIDKNLGTTSISLVETVSPPQLKLTVPSFLPQDSLASTDKILFYTDASNYVMTFSSVVLSASQTHDAAVTVTAKIKYYWNQQVKFRVKVGDGTSYTSDWSSLQNPYDNLVTSIPYTALQLGNNNITVEVSNSDGTATNSSILTNAVTLSDSAPQITVINTDSNNFNCHFTISDPDNASDTIQYQLSITNSKGTNVIVPWTTLVAPPIDINYAFDSSTVVVNDTNILKIDARDNYGKTASMTYSFTGTYKNIMFLDENGNYYSTDKQGVLQTLHFDNIVGGQTSEAKVIRLKNQNINNIDNLNIKSVDNNALTGFKIEFSKTFNPFTPLSELNYGDQQITSGGEITFYVRISTTYETQGIDNFYVQADATSL